MPISRRTFVMSSGLGVSALALQAKSWGTALSDSDFTSARKHAPVKGVVRRDETMRFVGTGGNGDCFHMTWARDDRQFASVCDGYGWRVDSIRFCHNRILVTEGLPEEVTLKEIASYPELCAEGEDPRYFCLGTLALHERVYQFLSFLGKKPMEHWSGTKLIYSPDNGKTWCNEDGSTPVVWVPQRQRTHYNMAFYEEPMSDFSVLSFLQMGKDYEHNTDGYVYVYSSHIRTAATGGGAGPDNKLSLFRVPKAQILNRSAYEYFVALQSDGTAEWSHVLDRYGAVFTFPADCSSNDGPSVVYLPAHRTYLMANSGTGCSETGEWFAKPSYLGFWTSPTPWGPWTQIHEELAWTPRGNLEARAYSPKIAPKWIAEDGRSFWLVWSDFRNPKEKWDQFIRFAEGLDRRDHVTHKEKLQEAEHFREALPNYRFNLQRVDLILA